MKFKTLSALFSVIISLFVIGPLAIIGCDNDSSSSDSPAKTADGKAKYVFLFIGDGMSEPQLNSAEVYKAQTKAQSDPAVINDVQKLTITQLPAQGFATTYSSNSYITDSAAAGTALACGYKTESGVISMDRTKTVSYETIAEMAKKNGMKVGIVSSVSIDHATPAVFYAHNTSRNNYRDIDMSLLNSGFDYFGGGGFRLNKWPDVKDGSKTVQEAYTEVENTAVQKGYVYADTRSEFDSVSAASGKVIAVNQYRDSSDAMPYALDRSNACGSGEDYEGSVTLAEYTEKGIRLLEGNSNGFFMMVEGGKIDWACHANDAASAIHDTLAFDNAVAKALEFYEKHPNETLIIVTGDHECGGMTIGFAGTGYSTFFQKLANQKRSYDDFDSLDLESAASLNDISSQIESYFGLDMDGNGQLPDGTAVDSSMALTAYEETLLENGFNAAKNGKPASMTNDEYYLLYGGYNPLSVTITHILNRKAGIAWTSYSHTGVPVPTFAKGAGSNLFNGYYDNTDIFAKMKAAMNL